MTLADALPPQLPTPRKPRRRAAAVAGVVGVAAIVGGGAWAWQLWAAQGPQPAEALPADTLAYVAVDLDPPGGQKVAAYNVLKKFPSLEKELGLDSQDDLRQSLVESIAEDGGCDLPWREVKDWAGDRVAAAVVPLDEPEFVVALQLADPDAARTGLEKVAASCGEEEFGFAIGEGWAILAESEEVAQQVQADAEHADLAGHGDFERLTGAAGDPGVVTVYAAPEAGQALLDAAEEEPFLVLFTLSPLGSLDPVSAMLNAATFLSGVSTVIGADAEIEPDLSPEEQALWDRMDHYEELTRAERKQLDKDLADFYDAQNSDIDAEAGADEAMDEEAMDEEAMDEEAMDEEFDDFFEIPADTRTALEDFSGLGGTARFDDGGVELEIVTDPFLTGYDGVYDGTDALEAIGALPADTAVAFGAGFADGWAERALQRNAFLVDDAQGEVLEAFEDATGLTPADLEALGGDTIAFAAKPGFEKAIDSESLADLTVAARITGDPAKIEAALAKVGPDRDLADLLQSKRTDDGVVIGPSPSYLAELVDPKETLAGTERFEDAVADAGDAIAITYGDVGAGDWLSDLFEGDPVAEDLASLSSVGVSVTRDGDQYRLVGRISFD